MIHNRISTNLCELPLTVMDAKITKESRRQFCSQKRIAVKQMSRGTLMAYKKRIKNSTISSNETHHLHNHSWKIICRKPKETRSILSSKYCPSLVVATNHTDKLIVYKKRLRLCDQGNSHRHCEETENNNNWASKTVAGCTLLPYIGF